MSSCRPAVLEARLRVCNRTANYCSKRLSANRVMCYKKERQSRHIICCYTPGIYTLRPTRLPMDIVSCLKRIVFAPPSSFAARSRSYDCYRCSSTKFSTVLVQCAVFLNRCWRDFQQCRPLGKQKFINNIRRLPALPFALLQARRAPKEGSSVFYVFLHCRPCSPPPFSCPQFLHRAH